MLAILLSLASVRGWPAKTGADERLMEAHKHGEIEAIDLFCGVGGLTCGLQQAGIQVLAGVDIDPRCQYPYEANNDAEYIGESVDKLGGKSLRTLHTKAAIRVLAGCAPCQPFSTYSQGNRGRGDDQWKLLREFSRLVAESKPHIVTMENVPKLKMHPVFDEFVAELKRLRYKVTYDVVKCEEYGLPQTRKRLVLLASKLGDIEILPPPSGQNRRSVRSAIGGRSKLQEIAAGGASSRDPMHHSAGLSAQNLQRIKASKPGGTWRDWPQDLVAECHKTSTGKTYPSVYGRMTWESPSPTITTQFYGYGNGRFGHPEQDRAISLREGAILQGFPRDYAFVHPDQPTEFRPIGRLIGNAVPPLLGKLIGDSIQHHVVHQT